MARCITCSCAVHDQFQGYCGRWICRHPHRSEISNSGDFTYPKNSSPKTTICETPAELYGDIGSQKRILADTKTPIWCYLDVVERSKLENPRFDPDKQRAILWPRKHYSE